MINDGDVNVRPSSAYNVRVMRYNSNIVTPGVK